MSSLSQRAMAHPPSRRQHLITTRVQPSACRHCHQAILIGLVEGLNTRVDPRLANRVDQAVAIICRRGVYTMINRTLTEHVDPLMFWPVLIEHRCGQPLGTLPVPAPVSSDDRPPF